MDKADFRELEGVAENGKERKMGKGMEDRFPKQPLSMIANIERGKFSARPRNDPQYYGGTTPFIQTGDIARADRTIVSWSQTLNEKGLSVSRLFPQGTILMAIAANIGDVAISSFETACPDSVVALSPRNGIDNEWLFQTLKFSKPGFAALATQNAQANLSLEKITPFKVHVPPIPEQRKIAEILRTWDETTERLEAETTIKEAAHRGYVKRLVNDPQCGRQRLRDHLQHVSNRNSEQKIERILSVTNSAGFMLAEDQFAHRIASADLSNYKIVQRGQYAYNPARINVGSIARLDRWTDGVLSPMYVVFQVKPSLDTDFFCHWLFSADTRQRIRLAAQGSVRETVSFEDLDSISLPVPSLGRQRAVARFLNESQRETELLRKLTQKYQQQKRGLMQKLLTGKWRVKD